MMGEEMQGINIKRAGSKCFYRLVNFVQETWRDCVLNAMRVEGLAENSVFTTVDFVPNRQSTRSLNTNDDVFDVRLLTELNLTEQAVEKRMRGDRMTSGLTWRRLFRAWRIRQQWRLTTHTSTGPTNRVSFWDFTSNILGPPRSVHEGHHRRRRTAPNVCWRVVSFRRTPVSTASSTNFGLIMSTGACPRPMFRI